MNRISVMIAALFFIVSNFFTLGLTPMSGGRDEGVEGQVCDHCVKATFRPFRRGFSPLAKSRGA